MLKQQLKIVFLRANFGIKYLRKLGGKTLHTKFRFANTNEVL